MEESSAKLWEFDQEEFLKETKIELDVEAREDIRGIDATMPSIVESVPIISRRYYPDTGAQMIEHQIETMLKRMYEEIESRWELRQPTGRLHVPTMMRTRAIGIPTVRIFRRREQSSVEQAKMGIFFCVDCSGSMNHTESVAHKSYKPRVEIAKDAVWAMATAFEKMESFVGVATFAYLAETEFVKDFGKAGWWDFKATSENSPSLALQWGEGMLRRLKVSENVENLMLIVMTDGGWESSGESTDSSQKAAAQFKRLNAEGLIETMEIHVGGGGSWLSPKHKIVIREFANFPKDLATVMQKVQQNIVRKLMA